MNMIFSADFETTTDINDCRVWAWCACEVGNIDNIYYGNSIDTFILFMSNHPATYYFHNASFDCEFIISYLFDLGWEHTTGKLTTNTFSTIISSDGKFYQMKLCFEKKGRNKANTSTIKDSLKKLPMSVDGVAKSFKLDISKLSIDYNAYREPNHTLTDEEIAYIKNDVQIVAQALEIQFSQGLEKLTIGSDALTFYKQGIDKKWLDWFPILSVEMDDLIRKAYKGGWTYVNPRFQSDGENADVIQGAGSVYDVNSLYPDCMYNQLLPYDLPIYFEGEYEYDEDYPLYIQFLTCSCKIKEGYLPTLQIKHSRLFVETEYLTDTEGFVELCMTNVDLELLFEHYDVLVRTYNGGFKFKAQKGMFTNYIDYWMDIKSNSTGGLRQIAKLMLNSLYGKFATRPDVTPKIPYKKENGAIGYMLGEEEIRKPVYTPLACFVTAWARYKTITSAQKVYDRFMYADTDSLHVLGTEKIEGLETHPTKLGCWKHESDFSKAKYIRAKTYMELITHEGCMVDGEYKMVEVNEYIQVCCAGMPKNLKDKVTFENFKSGLSLEGKLIPRHVNGGIVLYPTTFTLL